MNMHFFWKPVRHQVVQLAKNKHTRTANNSLQERKRSHPLQNEHLTHFVLCLRDHNNYIAQGKPGNSGAIAWVQAGCNSSLYEVRRNIQLRQQASIERHLLPHEVSDP